MGEYYDLYKLREAHRFDVMAATLRTLRQGQKMAVAVDTFEDGVAGVKVDRYLAGLQARVPGAVELLRVVDGPITVMQIGPPDVSRN